MERSFVEWLHASAPDRVVYEEPPLAMVLCQIRYTKRLGLDDLRVAPFQQEIEAEYPFLEKEEPAIQVEASVAGAPIQQTVEVSAVWKFTDPSRTWTVTVNEDFVSLETRRYRSFEDFSARLEFVVAAIRKTIKPTMAVRIGLRYVNQILIGDRSLGDIIKSDLLGPLAVPELRTASSQVFQSMTLELEGPRLLLQHGFFSTSPLVIQGVESPVSEPVYIVDFDVFEEFERTSAVALDWPSAVTKLEVFHQIITDLFRWVTTEQFRESLGSLKESE